jgi:thiol-disulfide isomerase/thioredoxin
VYQVRSHIAVVVTDATGLERPEFSPPPDERTVAVERPDRLLLQSSLGISIVSDGNSLTAWSTQRGKYWRDGSPLPLANLMQSPVAALLRVPLNARPLLCAGSDPVAALTLGAGQPYYVGREELQGRPAHHLRIRGPGGDGSDLMNGPDVDLWIAAEGNPVPLRITVTQPPGEIRLPDGGKITGAVALTETFQDWTFDPPAADRFVFSRPEGARRVADVSRVLEEDHPLLGRPAPGVDIPLLDEGRLRLADHAGKDVVLLDFWATWCQPCLMELPVVAQIASDYRDRGVVLYAVNQKERQLNVKLFLAGMKLDMITALDSSGTVSRDYDAQSIPHLVVIGRDGTVQAIHSGFGPGLEEIVRGELEALLQGVDLARDGLPETVGQE